MIVFHIYDPYVYAKKIKMIAGLISGITDMDQYAVCSSIHEGSIQTLASNQQ